MSLDKSLRKRGALVRARNVLKRYERLIRLRDEDRWNEDAQGPYGLPKVRVFRVVAKKAKKKEKEDAAAEGATADKSATADKKPAEKKAADKK